MTAALWSGSAVRQGVRGSEAQVVRKIDAMQGNRHSKNATKV